jgi:hypothetical protein
MATAYLAHEAAHIRYTDFGVFKSGCTSPIRKAIHNIIEDVRIEKRMADIYPGTRYTIEKTVAQLISEGGYETRHIRPTIRADEIYPQIKLALDIVRYELFLKQDFKPATTSKEFSISLPYGGGFLLGGETIFRKTKMDSHPAS